MDAYLDRLVNIWGNNLNDPSAALTWIESTPAQQEEEGLYLDFKLKSDNRSPTVSDTDKKNLAKSISGFANTDGGLVVWGVYAKGEKDNPDVAIRTEPINGLKRFVTQLNSLCGQVVTPPVPLVQNRAVPTRPGSDEGYVITIVPKRRDMLIHANSKLCHGCFIRSGDGFHELHPAIIAEFYSRRPSPNLILELVIYDLSKVSLFEEVLEAEHHTLIRGGDEPWGTCSFRQYIAVPWMAVLRNTGRGSADRVFLDLQVSASATWDVIDYAVERHADLSGPDRPPVFMPFPTTRFTLACSNEASGKILDPVHPGQAVTVAKGVLNIPFDAFEIGISDFQISGFAYAADSPHFALIAIESGAELGARFREVFDAKRKEAPATRVIAEPRTRRIILPES